MVDSHNHHAVLHDINGVLTMMEICDAGNPSTQVK